jgi:hypothetical protein
VNLPTQTSAVIGARNIKHGSNLRMQRSQSLLPSEKNTFQLYGAVHSMFSCPDGQVACYCDLTHRTCCDPGKGCTMSNGLCICQGF